MKICCVENCTKKHYAKGYCAKHWQQLRYYGKIPERTRTDPNEVSFDGATCKIKLYNMKNEVVTEAIIDSEDWPKIKDRKWCLSRIYVATKKEKGKSAYLHHAIMGEPDKGFEIDHINRNPLDNRKSNLRVCTRSQNAWNSGKQNTNKSGFKGVFKHKKKWAAQIKPPQSKTIHLGTFETPNLAARAYNEAALEFRGNELMVLNNI